MFTFNSAKSKFGWIPEIIAFLNQSKQGTLTIKAIKRKKGNLKRDPPPSTLYSTVLLSC